ncbi:MAG TPA: outer membrane lipoprotein carrier protein LolA, partial [Saprospiraceae bacterium]|nr:outer membrane lipoprotein carrier protein LolA [Saprospiraceae bacterium]
MKNFLLILLILTSVLYNAHAQYTSAKDSDPEALKLLQAAGQQLSAKYSQVTFSIKISMPGAEDQSSAGLLYQSGNAYRLELDDYTIISDGKTRWVYLKADNEVNIYNEAQGQDWLSPADFLQLHKASDLVFVLAGTKADGGSIIEAKPLKGRFEDYSKFTIALKGNALSSIKALSKDGIRQEMTIGTITHPATLDAAKLFTFNASQYPNAHI